MLRTSCRMDFKCDVLFCKSVNTKHVELYITHFTLNLQTTYLFGF